MSYDLMAFDPAKAPRTREVFLAWFEKHAEWSEEHSYDDPKVSSPVLRELFLELIKTYPPMNGPYASDDADDSKVTDYSIGTAVLYAAFAWSEADGAHEHLKELCAKHGAGFYDVSSDDGTVWFPDGKGGLRKAF
ncbi:MAG TPA: hypothetical protein VEK08_19680 [Planctomycetota bacterium]|nr:hypothetical protein [Planctomycetota bacterium]